MNTEITKNQKNDIMIPEAGFGMENILTKDVQVPKLLLMQQMSKFVTNDKIQARAGEIRESAEGRLMGTKERPVQIIPFYVTNTWSVRKEVDGKWEYDKTEARTAKDFKREWQDMGADGALRRNYRTLNLFCIVRGENFSVPYMVSMSSFSFKNAAQKIINKGAELKASGESYANRVFNLYSEKTKNDKGEFYVFAIESVKGSDGKDINSTEEEYKAAYAQYLSLRDAINDNRVAMNDLEAEETSSFNEEKY